MSMFCSDCAVNLKTGASAKYDAPKTLQLVMKGKPSSANTTGFVFTDLHPRSCFSSLDFLNIFLPVVVCSHRAQASHTSRANPALTCLLSNPCFILPFAANVCLPPTHTLTSWTMELNRSAEAGNQQSTWACSFQIVHRCLILPVHIATYLTIQKCASRFSLGKSRMNYF